MWNVSMVSKQSCKGRRKAPGLVNIFIRVQNEEKKVDREFNVGQKDFLIRKIKGIVWIS